MDLHVPTLLFVTAVVTAFAGGLMLLAQGPRRDAGAIGIWGAALLLGAMGFVLVAAGQGVPWVSDGLGTALFLAGTSVSWAAARVFAERPVRRWWAAAGPAAWLALVPLQGTPLLGRDGWLALSCAIGVACTLATASELWRIRGERLPSRPAVLALLLGHAAIYAARGADALLGHDAGRWASEVQAALLLESLLHTVGVAFLLLSLVKERVELRTCQQLRALALQDGLTGVGNRRQFDEQLAVEVARARRSRTPLALLMVDVDHFKPFNDAFGHQQGDACLRAVALALAGQTRRPRDLVTRYGGEEFAVLLADTGLREAGEVAARLCTAVAALGIAHTAPPGCVTVSIGVAALQSPRDGAEALVAAADRALYQAKAGGRNRVRLSRRAEVAAAA